MSLDYPAVEAQAEIHHAYLLGLLLMVCTRQGPERAGEWVFRLFRRQHQEKFLSSFEKLGLTGLPDAVACARYHVLSNSVGGVPVEYLYESDAKAWVRFRYPRWMFDGPTLCGVPVEVSRGLLRGWYARNGVSLGNPRLGFVCVSEDMTGEFGLCGYFRQYDHELSENERLAFAKHERPPAFDPAQQPRPPSRQWSRERLARAKRNYAVDYIRNGLVELASTIGQAEARDLGGAAARLIGLQYFAKTAAITGAGDGTAADAARYLGRMFAGMGDEVTVAGANDGSRGEVAQASVRIVRGLTGTERALVLACWTELWRGTLQSHRHLKALSTVESDEGLVWMVTDETPPA